MVIDTPCIDHGRKGMGLGYATAWFKLDGVRKSTTKHRIVFYEAHGYMPEVVEHLCNNPRCINVEHLRAGTHKSNAEYKHACGRGNIEAATRKGTDNGRAKLDDSTVRYLRQMYIPNDREWGASAIAKRLSMGVSSTHRMLTGAAWRHVV
ncbi:HNH endonuclease [Klebsiella phage VLCpiA1e]|nr:HNH endonuclease [Klebsiella phage VLCpiA1e]